MQNALVALLSSRKALVVLLAVGLCAAAVLTGKAQWQQCEDFMKWLLGSWLISQGIEDAAKHNATKAPNSVTVNTTASVPPPPLSPPDA